MADIKLKDQYGKSHIFRNVNYLTVPKADGGTVRAKIVGEDLHLDLAEPSANVDVSGFNTVSATYEQMTDETDIISGLLGEYAAELVADDSIEEDN